MRKQDLDVQHPSPQHVSVDVVGPETQHDDRCCGIGLGWGLFIFGFFFPMAWYVGMFKSWCLKDEREKPAYLACTAAASICTFIFILVMLLSHK